MHLKLVASHEKHLSVIVVAMLEKDVAVSSRVRQHADNRLDAIPRYENDKAAALDRVIKAVVGNEIYVH